MSAAIMQTSTLGSPAHFQPVTSSILTPRNLSGTENVSLCLSQIKSGHICDAVRRGSDGKEYALPSQRSAIRAHPYPRTGACASHYSNSYTTAAHDEDAARRTQQRGQGTPVGSNR